MQAAIKQESLLMLGQMYLSMIEYTKHDFHLEPILLCIISVSDDASYA